MKAPDWRTLLAHSHPFTVKLGGKSLRLCSRCTGAFAGFVVLSFIAVNVNLAFLLMQPTAIQISASLILAAPAFVDWSTQSWRLRESTNRIRLLTGLGEGMGISLLALIPMPFLYKMLIVLLVAGVVINIGLTGQRHRRSSACCLDVGPSHFR